MSVLGRLMALNRDPFNPALNAAAMALGNAGAFKVL